MPSLSSELKFSFWADALAVSPEKGKNKCLSQRTVNITVKMAHKNHWFVSNKETPTKKTIATTQNVEPMQGFQTV